MSSLPVLLALPWIIAPIVTLLRARRTRSLGDERADVTDDAPFVSLIIPARNESRNIRRCAESALSARYARLEVIVVDDHSTDDTGAIARGIAAEDARLRVITPPPLPGDWFGKQWACAAGARAARGAIIGFLDADTWSAPDLVPRVVNAMHARGSELLTVAGDQEMDSFWERMIQPQVFAVLLARFGGTEVVNDSRSVADKIANGQCMFFRRDAYDAMGGHASVKHKVAEDLALAQHFFSAGRRVTLIEGRAQLRTRMYASLAELVAGWGKNFYAGGVDAMPFGALGRLAFPLLLVTPGLSGLVPPVLLLLALAGVFGAGVLTWAAIVTSVNVVWWMLVYVFLGLSPLYALLHPIGAAVLTYIAVSAIARGRRVTWKGRDYRAA